MKKILLLIVFMGTIPAFADELALTPNSIAERAEKMETDEERQLLIDEIIASNKIENVQAAFRLRPLGFGVTWYNAIEKLQDSDFKDQIMTTIMKESWVSDMESLVSGSQGPAYNIYFCIEYLKNRAPELKLHTGPGTEERFVWYKERQKIVKALEDKFYKEKNPSANPALLTPSAETMFSKEQPNKESESPKNLAHTSQQLATNNPTIRYGMPVAILIMLTILYFVVKQRKKRPA